MYKSREFLSEIAKFAKVFIYLFVLFCSWLESNGNCDPCFGVKINCTRLPDFSGVRKFEEMDCAPPQKKNQKTKTPPSFYETELETWRVRSRRVEYDFILMYFDYKPTLDVVHSDHYAT